MHFCLRYLLALLLLASFAFTQEQKGTPAESKNVQTQTASTPPITLQPDASGTVPPEQIRALLEQAEGKDLENDKQLRNYTYVERQEEHRLDGRGNIEKTEIRTSEILQIYGEEVEKLIAKDDKPLPDEEAKKEDDKIQKIIDKRKNESEGDRAKRLEKEEKQREDDRKFVLEIADAFNFRLVGTELVGGRDTWVLEGTPRPGYEPKRKEAKLLSKFEGRVWLDKAEAQWVKLDITAMDTIAFGVFLARIHKGAHIVVDLTKINDEVWLPEHVQVRADAKVVLLKTYREDIEQTFRDYKKFRTDSKITVLGEETR
ncbi:MAG: hypothetical protein WCC04_20925 [Terriglobales bacterium]